MTEITEGVSHISTGDESQKKNRIEVSKAKKRIFYYVKLTKTYLQQHDEVELFALGIVKVELIGHFKTRRNRDEVLEVSFFCCFSSEGTIGGAGLKKGLEIGWGLIGRYFLSVSITEILKNTGFAFENGIRTSTVEIMNESKGRAVRKSKIEIVLRKTERFGELIAANVDEGSADMKDQD